MIKLMVRQQLKHRIYNWQKHLLLFTFYIFLWPLSSKDYHFVLMQRNLDFTMMQRSFDLWNLN